MIMNMQQLKVQRPATTGPRVELTTVSVLDDAFVATGLSSSLNARTLDDMDDEFNDPQQ